MNKDLSGGCGTGVQTRTQSERMKSGLRNALHDRVRRTWYGSEGGFSRGIPGFLARSAAWCYTCALRRDQDRSLRAQGSLPATVISIGNLTVGGTGKTPLTLWLARYFRKRGWSAAILSRGYGGSSRNASRVPCDGDTMPLVLRYGDEPVLLAARADPAAVWTGRDRMAAGLAAIHETGARVLLLDDGFQHLRVKRDIDLLLLDASNPFGNGSVLPFGPLREPVHSIQRAHAIVLTRADHEERTENTRSRLARLFPGKPIFCCRHELTKFRIGINGPAMALDTLKEGAITAFAGIADPQAFFRSLRNLGLNLQVELSFPDHHVYGRENIEAILRSSRQHRTRFLVTTEKDFVRLPADFHPAVVFTELDLAFQPDESDFQAFLERSIPSSSFRIHH